MNRDEMMRIVVVVVFIVFVFVLDPLLLLLQQPQAIKSVSSVMIKSTNPVSDKKANCPSAS